MVAKLLDMAAAREDKPRAILVVDNDAEVRDGLSALLERHGYWVEAAEDGASALKILESRSFDALLLDLHIPALDGLAVIARVRANEPLRHLPILVLSGSGDSTLKIAGLDCGANDYLTKPVDSSELLARLRVHLRVADASRQWREGCLQDPLTRLANRRGIHEALRREVARAIRDRVPLSLLFVDLDGFKAINDRFGHRAGDRLLDQFGNVIAGLCRAGDVAGRIGGDEFVLLLPGVGRRDALQVADRLAAGVTGLGVRASIGISVLFEDVSPNTDDPAAALIDFADAAMYSQKRSAGGSHHR